MTINTDEKLHGAAMLRLWVELGSSLPNIHFSLSTGISRNSYSLHANLPKVFGKGETLSSGIFIKVSNSRRSPWNYNFSKENQDEILSLKQKYGEVFAIFVAGNDGFPCLDFDRLKEILDQHHEDQERVSITRNHRENYRITGRDGDLERTLAPNTFPKTILEYFKNGLR